MNDQQSIITNDVLFGMERMPLVLFRRKYTILRISQLQHKYAEIDKMSLPHGSVLHILDNLTVPLDDLEQLIDTPRLDTNPLVTNEKNRKYVTHITEFNTTGTYTNTDKYIYRTSGLSFHLSQYRSQVGSKYKVVPHLNELPLNNANALSIINYNPLFRSKFVGKLPIVRKVHLILGTLFNTVFSLKDNAPNQYIHLPWPGNIYTRDQFINSRKAIAPNTVKFPNDWQYIVMMHLVNFLWESAETSMFKTLSDEELASLNFIIQCGEYATVFNLGVLKAMNEGNRAHNKFVNHLNALSVIGHPTPDTDDVKQQVLANITLDDEDLGEMIEDPTADVDDDFVMDTSDDVDIPDAPTITQITSSTPVITTSLLRRLDAPVTSVVKTPDDKVKIKTQASKLNVTATDNEKNLKVDHASKEYMLEQDAQADAFIDEYPNLTPRQRERCKRLARQYKQLKLGGRTIEDWLSKQVDNSLDVDMLDEKQLGLEMPDKGALTSTLFAYDRDYMKKTYYKHMAGTIISFQRSGVFLLDIKEEKTVSEMNNFTTYTLRFEDIDGKKSTVKFRVPTVDREGRIKIDGTQKVLKKQRINLPIVKIDETQVNLSSNFNKTLVERNVTKAHSFDSFIDTIFKSDKSTAIITFGITRLNEFPVSYEYAVLAQKYTLVAFKNGGLTWELYFSYPNRLEHFGGKAELLAELENTYGVYCGKNNTQWLFINLDNVVKIVDQKTHHVVESEYDTLLDIAKLSLKQGESINKRLTEWVTIRILDAKLPVMFLLAYRYGLRATLDYLKIDYTITEGRSRIILGEDDTTTPIEATESYQDEGRYLYHIVPSLDTFNKYGLCSPRELYEADPKLFHQQSYQIYKHRTAEYLHMSESDVTDIDVLTYLDGDERAPFTSRSVFCSLIPLSEMPNITDMSGVEIRIPIKLVKQMTNEIIIADGPIKRTYSWSRFDSEYNKLVTQARKGATLPITNGMRFAKIVHVAVNVGKFTPDQVELVGSSELVPSVESLADLGVSVHGSDYYFYLSDKSLGNRVELLPHLPAKTADMLHDTSIARIEVTDSVAAAIVATGNKFIRRTDGAWQRFSDVYVYAIKKSKVPEQAVMKYEQLLNDESSYDIMLTGAEWITRPTTFELAGVITIDYENVVDIEYPTARSSSDASGTGHMFDYQWKTGKDPSGGPAVFNAVDYIEMDAVTNKAKLPRRSTFKTFINRIAQFLHLAERTGYVYTTTRSKTLSTRPYFDMNSTGHYTVYQDLQQAVYRGMENGVFAVYARHTGDMDRASWVSNEDLRKRDADAHLNGETWFVKPTMMYYCGLINVTDYEHGQYEWQRKDGRAEVKDALVEADEHFTTVTPATESLTPSIPALVMTIYSAVEDVEYDVNDPVLPPEKLLDAKVGSCWDTSLAVAYLCSKGGLDYEYVFLDLEDSTTHATVVVHCDGRWWWLEPSWRRHLGVHGFNTLGQAMKAIVDAFIKEHQRPVQIATPDVSKLFHDSNITHTKYLDTVGSLLSQDELEPATEALDVGDKRYHPKKDDIAIKFADRVLWFNRYPLTQSLVAAGLDHYDLTPYNMAEFESKDVYYRILQDSGISLNYLKGIDSFFDLFVDNMTYNILKSMNEPTNVRDLLIRSAELLSTLDHKAASARANHRIRGYEQFNAVLYNELSRQFSAYQASRTNKATVFSVNPEAVYLRLVSNASLVTSEAANPIQNVKEGSYMTYAGVGGRTAESFVVDDRKFSQDDIGIISEATVDNSKVGMMAQLSWNPGIENTEGILSDKSHLEVKPSEGWSATALTFPFTSSDDSNRANMLNIQCTHMVPTQHIDRMRVRTGFERTFAHRCSREFAGIADKNGKVIAIDDKTHMVQVRYDDGTEDCFKFGEEYVEFQGFHVTQDIRSLVTVGQKIKKGDVITYNAGFFTVDHDSKQLDLSIGVLANIAFIEMDVNLEDGSEISQRLADKLGINPTQTQDISLTRNNIIHKCVSVGDHVKVGDPLMIFEEDTTLDNSADSFNADEETTALLANLNKRTPRAKFSGEIVRIEAHYGGPIADMHPSIATLVRHCIADVNRAAKLAEGTSVEESFPPSAPLPSTVKYRGVQFTEDVVMFSFYIKEHESTTIGDKIVVCNQLKNTVGNILRQPVYTEDRSAEIDVLFSSTSASRRIALSPILMGLSSRVMEKLENDVLDMYFN